MKFEISFAGPPDIKKDLLVVFAESAEFNQVDKSLNGLLKDVISEDFENKPGSDVLIYPAKGSNWKKILVLGWGEEKLTYTEWLTICGHIGARLKKTRAATVSVLIPDKFSYLTAPKIIRGLVTGIILGGYTFTKHKKLEKENVKPGSVTINLPGKFKGDFGKIIKSATVIADATILTRDLVNEPSNITTPGYLARLSKSIASEKMKVTVMDKDDLGKLGMDAFLSIARGSAEPPKFIRFDYKGGGGKNICLVGKGITFDSGGISLKSQKGLEAMKTDMAGAAAILGIMKAVCELSPGINLTGIIAACENMPSGTAVKPGDIVTAYNKKTIEIVNTDAEGRVILADALSYASDRVKPDIMIDLATLTGACIVALGEEIIGFFVNNDQLKNNLNTAADNSGERIWQLPLPHDYLSLMKSRVADLKNVSGTGHGGAITGAIFLSQFVNKGIAWAHLDIAGPAYQEKDSDLNPYGGTGSGVRMILEYLLNL